MKSRRLLGGGLLGLAFCWGLAGSPSTTFAAEPAPKPAASQKASDSPKKQRTILVASYLLIALTVGGVSLLILVMLWGARVRRQTRRPLPQTSPHDPLWYIKGKKPSQNPPEPKPPPEASESETTSE